MQFTTHPREVSVVSQNERTLIPIEIVEDMFTDSRSINGVPSSKPLFI